MKETAQSIITDNAVMNGRSAYLDGVTKEENPYKDGPYSSRPFWDIGWDYEKKQDA